MRIALEKLTKANNMSFLWSKLFQWQKKNTRYKMPTKDQHQGSTVVCWGPGVEPYQRGQRKAESGPQGDVTSISTHSYRTRGEGQQQKDEVIPFLGSRQLCLSITRWRPRMHTAASLLVSSVWRVFFTWLSLKSLPHWVDASSVNAEWRLVSLWSLSRPWFFRTPGNRWFLWAFLFSLLNGARALQLTFCSCQLYMK